MADPIQNPVGNATPFPTEAASQTPLLTDTTPLSDLENPTGAHMVRGQFGQPIQPTMPAPKPSTTAPKNGPTIRARQGVAEYLDDLYGRVKAAVAPETFNEKGEAQPNVGELMAGPVLGPIKAVSGLARLYGSARPSPYTEAQFGGKPSSAEDPKEADRREKENDEAVRGFNDALGGGFQTLAPLAVLDPAAIGAMPLYNEAANKGQAALTKAGLKPATAEAITNLALVGGPAILHASRIAEPTNPVRDMAVAIGHTATETALQEYPNFHNMTPDAQKNILNDMEQRVMTNFDNANKAAKVKFAQKMGMTPKEITDFLAESAKPSAAEPAAQLNRGPAPALRAAPEPDKFAESGGKLVGPSPKAAVSTPDETSQDIYTKDGAQTLANHIGAQVVGSVAEKGTSTHDLDLRVDTYDQPKIEAAMKAKGFEPIGSSVVSPAEAKASGKNFGGVNPTDWSRAHHFESTSTPRRKVDIWHSEPADVPDPIEDLIMSDKIGGKKVRGATSLPERAKSPVFDMGGVGGGGWINSDGEVVESRGALTHANMAVEMGYRGIPDAMADGNIRIGANEQGENIAIHTAGIPNDAQMHQIADLMKEREAPGITYDLESNGRLVSGEASNLGMFRRILDQTYPFPEAFAEHGGEFVGKSPEAADKMTTAIANLYMDRDENAHPFAYSYSAPFTNKTAPSLILPDGRITNARLSHSELARAAGFEPKAGELSTTHIDDMLDSTGAARIIYPEGGRGNIGVQIHQPPTQDQLQIVAHNLNKAAQAGVGDGSLVWDLKNSEGGMISGSGSIGDFRRAVDAAYPDQQDIISKSKIEEEPHKSSYAVAVTETDGTQRIEKVDAHTNNEAMKLAQKKFPGVELERRPEMDTTHTPSTKYEVPTGKRIKMPPSYNRPEEDTERHEVAHALVALKNGLQTGGVLSTHHPIVSSDSRAVHLLKGAGLRDPATGRIREDKRTAVLASGMAGIASDEIQGVPRASNINFFINEGGDGESAYKILTAAGFSHEDAMTEMHRLIDENIEYLKHPAYASVVNENVGFREKGLSRQFHYSPERLQNMHAEIERRKANGEPTATDNRTSDETTAAGRTGDVARGEGEISAADKGLAPEGEEGIVSEEKIQPKNQEWVDSAKWEENPNTGYRRLVLRDDSGKQAGRIAHDNYRIRLSELDDKYVNQGIGKALYERAFADAKQNGVKELMSDTSLSPDAARVWDSLAKSGKYNITAEPSKEVNRGKVGNVYDNLHTQYTVHFDQPKDIVSEEKIKRVPKEEPVPEISPNEKLQASAQKYAAAHDMPEINHAHVEADPKRAAEIAKIYDEAKHDPNDPRVKAAYDALKSETLAQFKHLRNDLKLKFKPQEEDPYNSAEEMMDDIKKNNTLKVFTGSGTGADHPLSAIAPGTGGQTYNIVFRWVHDAMGHAAGGNDFSENGEKSATEAHAQMYSDIARPAMRAETEGQTSWFFHNPEVESGKAQPGKFAEQKATLLPDVSHDWHETAGKMAATNEAGGINPRTGKSDTKGVGLEILPESRQPLDHAPTANDFQKFYAKNQAIFDQYPELRVGFDNASAVKGGHEINVGAVGPNAAHVAARLDQKSAFDIAERKIIPTGGTGLQTEFKNYPLERRIKDLNAPPELRPSTGGTPEAPAAPPMPKASESLPLVSTRMPSKTVKGETIEEHTNGALTSDMQAATAAPGYLEKLADRVADTPGFKDPGGDAVTRTNAYIRHVADNVKFVWSKLTPEAIKHDEQWYPVGAHERGIEVAKQHAIDPHQAYAVTAALSPLTDWDQNTSQAERAVNIWKNQQGTKFTPEMKQAGKDIASIPAMKKFASKFKKLEGKTLGELTDVRDQALWLRLYDEGHNSRAYQTWNPDGTPAGIAKNQDGSPKAMGWSFQNLIEHAIDILKDGSQENISKVLGTGHKVRNFYNNQLAPDDPRFLTIDTHAVNVGQLRSMPGQTPAIRDNFGGISNKPYGLKGTYALHDAGYRLAAKELDIPIPSRLQSPTWVKIREVFPNKFKTPENQQAIDAIWKEHTDGKITIDDARNKIWDYAEGWNSRNAGGVGDTSDQGELFNVGVHGESAEGAAGRGTGSDVAPANQEVAPEEDTSFNFGANVKPAEARSRTSKISATQRAKNDAMVKGLAGLIKSGKK